MQEENTHQCGNITGWNYAVDVAEGQIKEAEARIARLKVSIRTFREMQEKGEPFPGEEINEKAS